jgi:hypothetical protein
VIHADSKGRESTEHIKHISFTRNMETSEKKETKVCRLCGNDKPIEEFPTYVRRARMNRKGELVKYSSPETRCRECRTNKVKQSRNNPARVKVKAPIKIRNGKDSGFVFSSNIKDWY